MKGAFVIRLGPGTRPSENHFEGWAEEVDSGKEVKFHSLDDLARFFGERLRIGLTREERRRNSGNEIESKEEDL